MTITYLRKQFKWKKSIHKRYELFSFCPSYMLKLNMFKICLLKCFPLHNSHQTSCSNQIQPYLPGVVQLIVQHLLQQPEIAVTVNHTVPSIVTRNISDRRSTVKHTVPTIVTRNSSIRSVSGVVQLIVQYMLY